MILELLRKKLPYVAVAKGTAPFFVSFYALFIPFFRLAGKVFKKSIDFCAEKCYSI